MHAIDVPGEELETSPIFAPSVVLDFTPATDGRHIFLASATFTEAPSQQSIGVHLFVPGDIDVPAQTVGNNRAPVHSAVWIRDAEVSATAEQARLLVRSAAGSTISHQRVVAFDADAESVESSGTLQTSVTGTDPMVVNALEVTKSGPRRDVITIQRLVLDNGLDLPAIRFANFQRDGVPAVRLQRSCASSCPRPSYGRFDGVVLENQTLSLDSQAYSSEAADVVDIWSAYTYAFTLRPQFGPKSPPSQGVDEVVFEACSRQRALRTRPSSRRVNARRRLRRS